MNEYPPNVYLRNFKPAFYLFVAVGIVVLLIGIFGVSSQRIWLAYLVNFVFWSGLAQAGIVFSAAYRITNGKWGEPVRRIAEGFIVFIPLSVLLFLVTFLGRHYLWSWIDEPIPAKTVWLSVPFFFLRVTFYYLFMSLISIWYVYHSLRLDLGLMKEKGFRSDSKWFERLTKNWRGVASETERSRSIVNKLVPLLLISFAVTYSMIGFDVVMSLEPYWYSTLYGWLNFVHAFFSGVGGILLVTILARKYLQLESEIHTSQLYDGSRLLMGLSMLSGGFYWAQYLVIWYGNLGEEIGHLIIRFHHDPWPPIQWMVIVVLYFFPLIVFLSRSIKEKPLSLAVVVSIILIGNWFYQYIEIVPSVWKESFAPLGLIEIGMTLGFLGLFGLCWLSYMKHFPLVIKREATLTH